MPKTQSTGMGVRCRSHALLASRAAAHSSLRRRQAGHRQNRIVRKSLPNLMHSMSIIGSECTSPSRDLKSVVTLSYYWWPVTSDALQHAAS
jgi:hypothetical protein